MSLIIILSLIGFLIAFYVYVTEKKLAKDSNYKLFCDFSDTISCSKPMLSKYSAVFGVSNAAVGMAVYAALIFLEWFSHYCLVFYASAVLVFASVLFAYILYFKLRTLCILCTIIYVINILLLIVSYQRL